MHRYDPLGVLPFVAMYVFLLLLPSLCVLLISLCLSLYYIISISICLRLHLSPSPSVSLFLCISFSVSHFSLYICRFDNHRCDFIYLPVCPFVCMPMCLSYSLSVLSCFVLSLYLWLFVSTSVRLSVCMTCWHQCRVAWWKPSMMR